MRIALFCHSLVSDWNHGNAHFLRGIATELILRGHEVEVHEPAGGWSRANLLAEQGPSVLVDFHDMYPLLESRVYDPAKPELERLLDGCDLAVVHEWNAPGIVRGIGRIRARTPGMRALFHDTHHRLATEPEAIRAFDLSAYDGVLAFGRVIADLYRKHGLARLAWTWHEAADTRVFRPLPRKPEKDLAFVGNWGDGERTGELREYLLGPARALGLSGTVHGVRYPAEALAELEAAGLEYAGWTPNFRVPAIFARHRATVHVPRRPYAEALPGIPTIRVFEALACGIPLVCSPWEDAEGLFRPDEDYLIARTGGEMAELLRTVLHEPDVACFLAANGLETILSRHTCGHRVDELLDICREIGLDPGTARPAFTARAGEARHHA